MILSCVSYGYFESQEISSSDMSGKKIEQRDTYIIEYKLFKQIT